MSRNIGKWSAQASIDASGVQRGAAQVIASAKGMESSLEGVFGRMGAAVKFPGLSLGFESVVSAIGIQSGRQFIDKFQTTVDENLELGFLSDRLGAPIEFVSALQTVALESNVTAEQFSTSLDRMNQTLGQASLGSTEAQSTFTQLGLSWQNLAGQRFDQNYMQVAQALSQIENRAERARIATELFGRGAGQTVLRMMNEGAGGLARALADVQARGGFITDADRARMDAADNAMDRLTTNMRNSWREFVVSIAPAVTTALSAINTGVTSIGDSTRSLFGDLARLRDLLPSPPEIPGLQEGPPGPEAFMGPNQEAGFTAGRWMRRFMPMGSEAVADLGQSIASVLPDSIQERMTAVYQHSTEMLALMSQRAAELETAFDPSRMLVSSEAVTASLQSQAYESARLLEIWNELADLEAGEEADNTAASANTRAVDQATAALQRQAATFGLAQDEIRRFDLVAGGATDSQLRAFDLMLEKVNLLKSAEKERIEIEQQLARAKAEAARAQAVANLPAAFQMASQLHSLEKRFSAGMLTPDQFGMNLAGMFGRMGQEQAPLLGSLSAGSTEAAQAIQGAMTPQADRLAGILAAVEAAADEAREHRLIGEELRDHVKELRAALAGAIKG